MGMARNTREDIRDGRVDIGVNARAETVGNENAIIGIGKLECIDFGRSKGSLEPRSERL